MTIAQRTPEEGTNGQGQHVCWRTTQIINADLDGFVCPSRYQPRSRHVERGTKDACLRLKGSGLWDVLHILERRAGVVVPKSQRAVVP
jgi:hypothetical protein